MDIIPYKSDIEKDDEEIERIKKLQESLIL